MSTSPTAAPEQAASAIPGEVPADIPAATPVEIPATTPAAPAAKTPAKAKSAAATSGKAKVTAKAPVAKAKDKASKPVAEAILPAADLPAAKASKAGKVVKEKKVVVKKPKLVRDSFTFPETDYAKFATLKQRALKIGHEVKKSELLRAGLATLSDLSDDALLQALGAVDKLKPGRPAK
jgi:hypothetical protein